MTLAYRLETAIEYTGETKHSPIWRGLNPNGKPLSVNCYGHTPYGICADCAGNLKRVLSDVPMIYDDLDIALAGESRFIEHGTRGGKQALGEIGNARNPAILAQQRLTLAMRGDGTGAHPGVADWFDDRDPGRLALHLAAQLQYLRDETRMPALAVDVSGAVSRAHRVIDAPVDMVYYGPCPDCGRDIVAERIHHTDIYASVKCGFPSCGYARSLAEHQQTQLMANLDRWLTVTELVSAFTLGGVPVTRNQINWWAKHEGLPREPRVRDAKWRAGELIAPAPVFTYRVGDVLELAWRAEQRRVNRAERKRA